MIAEMTAYNVPFTARDPASMRPRSDDRGNIVGIHLPKLPLVGASMRPRSDDRGNEKLLKHMRAKAIELQ